MKTAIYVRVSTDDQVKHGYSIKDQIRQCMELAGTEEVEIYNDEGYSGAYLNRPALTRLRDDLQNGKIKKVIAYHIDRLARGMKNMIPIVDEIKRKAELVFVSQNYEDTPNGELLLNMQGVIAQYEKEIIKERMTRGRRQKAKEGKVVKNYYVYGYDYDTEKGQFLINEHEANVIRLIFDLYTKPNETVKGINGIAKLLTEKKVPTKRGAKVWHRQVVRQILMNRTYIGEFYQNRWKTEGMLGNKFATTEDERIKMEERPKEEWINVPVPAIVSKEQFEFAQIVLEKSRREWGGKRKNNYLLSGMLRCSVCGNTLTGRKAKNWGKYVLEYTDRKNTAGAKHPGCGNTHKVEELDEVIWNHVLSWLEKLRENDIEELNNMKNSTDYERNEIDRLQKEIERLEKRKRKATNLLLEEDDEDVANDIRERMKADNEYKTEILTEIERLQEVIQERDKMDFTNDVKNNALAFINERNPEDLTFEEKRELLRYLIREIKIDKEGNFEIYTY